MLKAIKTLPEQFAGWDAAEPVCQSLTPNGFDRVLPAVWVVAHFLESFSNWAWVPMKRLTVFRGYRRYRLSSSTR